MNRVGWTAPGLRDPVSRAALADCFIRAGAAAAEWALRCGAPHEQGIEILRRAAAQAALLLSSDGSDSADGGGR